MTQELATEPDSVKETSLAPTAREDAILTTIARAAQDERVDVDKMERLLAMQERVLADQSRRAANTDLARFKALCPHIKKGRGIVVKNRLQSNYAPYEDMMREIRPFMEQCGFSERFDTQTNPQGAICAVRCTIIHRDGHQWDSTFPVVPDTSGNKNSIQAIGSALSYGKRYSIGAALGLVFEDEDDDGNMGRREVPLNTEERAAGEPVQFDREAAIRKIEGNLEANGATDGELTEAMAILVADAPAEASQNWRNHTDPVLGSLAHRGWGKAMAKIAQIRKEAE